ncbi:MAG: hypothetical protein AAF416_02585 [Pseudomonadota bacterium]
MANATKVIFGLAAIFFVLLAFGPGGFLVGNGGGGSSGIGTIGIAEEFKARQGETDSANAKGVADKRFRDAPGEIAKDGEGEGEEGGSNEYDFFGTLARTLGLQD